MDLLLQGWGLQMAQGALMTIGVSSSAFTIGLVIGILGAIAKLSSFPVVRIAAEFYTTVLRGIPDLLVIYLLYFGGSSAVTSVAQLFGHEGFMGVNSFLIGAIAVGIVSGAYSTEVIRGALLAIPKGEIEAGLAHGISGFLLFRRIVAPQLFRFALPGLGNVWQLALKESALISVTGLAEIMRQASVGAGSTQQPFTFYFTAALLYLALTSVSGWGFRRAEAHTMRGVREA
jgi:octopine/nopaline transport system permease protein